MKGLLTQGQLIGDFIHTNKEPLQDEITAWTQQLLALKDRKTTAEWVKTKFLEFVKLFISGVTGTA